MDVLIKPNDGILLALGRQARFKNKNYRLNQFLLIEDIMGGKLIHNQLTASLIFLTNKEFEMIYDKESNEPYIKFLYDDIYNDEIWINKYSNIMPVFFSKLI